MVGNKGQRPVVFITQGPIRNFGTTRIDVGDESIPQGDSRAIDGEELSASVVDRHLQHASYHSNSIRENP